MRPFVASAWTDGALVTGLSRKPRKESEEYLKASSLLSSQVEELGGVFYRPRTDQTRATYELLLSFILQSIGDQVGLSIGYKLDHTGVVPVCVCLPMVVALAMVLCSHETCCVERQMRCWPH